MKRRIMRSVFTAILLATLILMTSIFAGATSEVTPEISIAQGALSLRDSVCIKYAVKSNVEDVKLLVWMSPEEDYVIGTEDYVIEEYSIETIGGVQYKIFDFTKLAAKQMADSVYTRAYSKSGGKDYYSELNKYSILQYAYNKLGKTGDATDNEELKNLLCELLEYGAAAQIYLNNYKTDRLATADWYQVKVSGGLLDDGTNHGLYLPGDAVTLIAPEYGEDDGIEFSHWENSDGEKVSTERIFELTVGEENETYTAITKQIVVEPENPPEITPPFKPTESPLVSTDYGMWYLSDIPVYTYGTLSNSAYIAGGGLDPTMPVSTENLMQLSYDTTAAQFKAYLAKLEKTGYAKEFYREEDSNLFASYVKNRVRVYAYYMSRTREARIIREYLSTSTSINDFGYTYVKSAGEGSVLYQYAIPMHDENHIKDSVFKNNGMLYVLKLADNSVVIIDGANKLQMSDAQAANFMNMLWSITGSNPGDTVRIAAWYITHSHSDHYYGFREFIYDYSEYLDLERVFCAFPSLNSPNAIFSEGSGADVYKNISSVINSYFGDDDTQFMRLHTGQEFNLADVTFEVLFTHEDAVNPISGNSTITNFNDTSAIIRITVDGETFLLLGDAYNSGMSCTLANWSADYLLTDGVQLAHHGMNDLTALYDTVKATTVLVPQAYFALFENSTWIGYYEAATAYARDDMIFFANEYTYGIAVVDGEWTKVYALPRPLEDSELN